MSAHLSPGDGCRSLRRRPCSRIRARFTKALGPFAAVLLAGLATSACGGATRFALRPPVLRDADDRPLSHAPAHDEESDYANTLNVTLLRPISHAFLVEPGGEAHNVNALDEVADSTWFTNRAALPAALERGTCPDAGPVPPFKIKSTKSGGTTPGFVVKDARGQKYMLKLDGLGPGQPEISTASDAIVSRLYWAVGFNAPCDDVIFIDAKDMRLDDKSTETLSTGSKQPLTAERLAERLSRATRDAQGKLRFSASRFIDGEGVGTWRTEGVRKDDPNDVIPHEDRRELRGERFLAAWVAHWDSRTPNSFDSFVPAPGGGGYVLHYFLDFSESLGGTWGRTEWAEPRLGFTTVSNAPQIATDAMTFGFVRRPWDDVSVDPRYPNLGYFDVAHFNPMGFSPQTPLVRWARAEPQDLAWMARRLAQVTLEHVRVAVRQGKLSHPAEEARLVEILMGRREKILRASFARVSPLASVKIGPGDRLCASDLGVVTGLASANTVSYALDLREGSALDRAALTRPLERGEAGQVCVALPPHFAPADAAEGSAERYAILDIARTDGPAKTTLRAHFYDLGPERGFALAGLERP